MITRGITVFALGAVLALMAGPAAGESDDPCVRAAELQIEIEDLIAESQAKIAEFDACKKQHPEDFKTVCKPIAEEGEELLAQAKLLNEERKRLDRVCKAAKQRKK